MKFIGRNCSMITAYSGFQNSCVSDSPSQRPQPRRGIISLFRRWRSEPTTYRRTIRFVRPDDAGSSNDQGWQMIQFEGRSAYTLRMEVTGQRREHYLGFKVTLCAWGGRYGRLTPLTADLPRNQEPMAVVVLTVGSPGENFVVFPLLCAVPVPVVCHLMRSVQ
jgi:hypothetical protein